MADRGHGNAKLVRGLRDAQVTARRLEGAERVERGYIFRHRRLSAIDPDLRRDHAEADAPWQFSGVYPSVGESGARLRISQPSVENNSIVSAVRRADSSRRRDS